MHNTIGEPVSAVLKFNAVTKPARRSLWKCISFLERATAGIFLLLLAPGLLVVAMTVICLSRRSPFVAHRRMGQGGKDVWLLKLRTMWTGSQLEWSVWPFVERVSTDFVPGLKPRFDARVTSKFAAFCRQYSIDEIPQFWHVARGEMSLVGPRPLMPSELLKHYGPDRSYLLSVKPGITGLWQIKGRSRLTYPQRRRLDLFMIRHWSLGLYATILKATIPRVLAGKDAW